MNILDEISESNLSNDEELDLINQLGFLEIGRIEFDGKIFDAQLEKVNGVLVLRIDEIINFDIDEIEFKFISKKYHLFIDAPISIHRNSISLKEKSLIRYSEGKIQSICSQDFKKNQPVLLRSYYFIDNNDLIYNYFGIKSKISVKVNENSFLLFIKDKHLVIDSIKPIKYEVFEENCYNIMVAIGFLTGDFFQNEKYTFQQSDKKDNASLPFEYRKLRSSSHSIFHALTLNPFSYRNFIGDKCAEQLYKENILKPLDEASFSKLVELIENNSQIQYALVLFNEANNKKLSLLIQNNCLYAVLEILKKFFFEKVKDNLPQNYSQKGNIEKYKMVFDNIVSLSNENHKILEMRNFFLHGDIKNIEGKEMIEIMQKQIVIIYKLLFTFIGFNGYIIDHFAIRNNYSDKAFIKIN